MPKKNGEPTAAEIRQKITQEKLNNFDFVIQNAELLNWKLINEKYYLPEDVLVKCSKYVRWDLVGMNNQLSEETILKFYKRITATIIVGYQNQITVRVFNQILPLLGDMEWKFVSKKYHLPMFLIEKHYMQLDLDLLKDTHLTQEEKELLDGLRVMKKLTA